MKVKRSAIRIDSDGTTNFAVSGSEPVRIAHQWQNGGLAGFQNWFMQSLDVGRASDVGKNQQDQDDFAIQVMIQNHLAQLRSYQATIRASMNATAAAQNAAAAPASASASRKKTHGRPFLPNAKDRAEQFEQCKRRFREDARLTFAKKSHIEEHTLAKVVLVVGPSGCGKSTLTTIMAEALSCSTIRQDEYFTQDFKDYEERQDDVFETAEHIDWVKIRANVRLRMSSERIVIVEGHHVASTEAGLREIASYVVIMEGSREVSRSRRLARRTRSPEEHAILARYFDRFVWPSFLKYGKPAHDELRAHCAQKNCPILCVPGNDVRTPAQLAKDVMKTFHL